MRTVQLHPFSLLAGSALTLIAVVSMGQQPVVQKAEYQVVVDVSAVHANKLAKEGWVYEGYLGTSKLGAGSDETLWKRAKQ